jgi:predicted signal transduction protein with EAL and GGDEF domain
VTVEQEFLRRRQHRYQPFPQDGGDAETLLKNADVAMYRAKERGRNTYEFFTKELTQSSLARLQMETDLRRAIDRGELRVFLQPQFSLSSGELVGAEALVRWLRPELGLVMPGEFIKLAEESGLIVPIGEWVQQTAAGQWAAWVPPASSRVCCRSTSPASSSGAAASRKPLARRWPGRACLRNSSNWRSPKARS